MRKFLCIVFNKIGQASELIWLVPAGFIFGQGPSSNALRAAANSTINIFLISFSSGCNQFAICWISNFCPFLEIALTHLPPINIFKGFEVNSTAFRFNAIKVDIFISSLLISKIVFRQLFTLCESLKYIEHCKLTQYSIY